MIHARGLTHTFKTRTGREKSQLTAVDGVDLDVTPGEIVGFLGPNGAGKTTTLRILTTLLRPTAGQATVAGYDVRRQPEQVRRRIGYVSQSGSTGSTARAGDEVIDHGMLYGLTNQQATARGRDLFARLDLDGMWQRQPRTMSGGQRRRLDIVMGLIHQPTLVFLDEPTSGLDPQARANLWQHITDLRSQHGVTVFLTTHYLDEADALSDRIVIIDHGSIVAADTPANLKATVAGDLIVVQPTDSQHVAAAATTLGAFAGTEASVDGLVISARVPRAGAVLPDLVREFDRAGIGLASIDVQRPTLDDVFLTLTGRSLRDAA